MADFRPGEMGERTKTAMAGPYLADGFGEKAQTGRVRNVYEQE